MMYYAAVWIPLRVVLAVALVLLEALVVRVVMCEVFLFLSASVLESLSSVLSL